MRVRHLNFLVSNFIFITSAYAGDLPSWITKGPLSDSSFQYVVCSHDGIDPEEARQIAESKCLASAAKLGGVNVKLTQKTVQSLTGSDSSEVAEIQPLEVNIKCEWMDRFLENIKDGFRVWLRCKVVKLSMLKNTLNESEHKSHSPNILRQKHAQATFILSTMPKADRIVITGIGERVIEPNSNVININVSNLDEKINISKSGYKNAIFEIPKNFLHGSKIQKDIILEKN